MWASLSVEGFSLFHMLLAVVSSLADKGSPSKMAHLHT